jgi:hypothetical protein
MLITLYLARALGHEALHFFIIAIAKFKGFFNFVILYLKGEKRK